MSALLLTYMESMPVNDNFSYQIIQGLLHNIHKIPQISAEKMSELCNVSPSALRKYVGTLGYKSYAEFRISFRTQWEKNYDPEGYFDAAVTNSSLKDTLNSLRNTLDIIEKDVDESIIESLAVEIHAAKKVIICAHSSNSIRLSLMAQMVLDGKEIMSVHCPHKLSDYYDEMTPDTIVLLFRTGRNQKCYTFTDLVAMSEKHVRVALTTSFDNPSERVFITYPLCFHGGSELSGEIGVDAISLCILNRYIYTRKQGL